MRTLIVGLGRSGLGLHLPVVTRLAQAPEGEGLLDTGPVVGYDCDGAARRVAAQRPGLRVVSRLRDAAEQLPPDQTVVHVCTPPTSRFSVLNELAALGFRHILVEKPLAVDRASVVEIERLRTGRGLNLTVVAPWLHSELTRRLARLVGDGRLGTLQSIETNQLKARFSRTLTDRRPLSAFDIEVPHALGVVLRLAGDGDVVDAAWSDLSFDGKAAPHMGTARMVLRHQNGVHTEIFSDLGAPSRVRRIRLEFDGGSAVGDFPVSADDMYAQLTVTGEDRVVVADDALGRFLSASYRTFVHGDDTTADYEVNTRVAALLCDAKERCAGDSPATGPMPSAALAGSRS